MRNSTLSLVELEKSIYSIVLDTHRSFENEKSTFVSQKASPYNTPISEKDLPVGEKFLSQRYKDLIGYLILIHFMPVDEKHYAYMLLDFIEHLRKNEQSFWLIALTDQSRFLKWLDKQETLSARAFFSDICTKEKLISLMNSIVTTFEETFRRPRRPIRRRGYKDKGSRAPEDVRYRNEELRNSTELRDLQFSLEEKEESHLRDISLLRQYLDDEIESLTEAQLCKFRFIKGGKEND